MTAPVPDFRSVARILAKLPADFEARAHRGFRSRGGSSSRWTRRDWLAMAYALTATEDALELAYSRFNRDGLRTMRRVLEDAGEQPAQRRARGAVA